MASPLLCTGGVLLSCPTTTSLAEGLRLHRAGQLEEAAKIYQQLLSEDPQNSSALHLLGVVARNIGRPDDAVELISQSLRIDGNNVPAISDLAGALRDQGRHDEAIEFYEAAIAASPDEAYLHSNLGNALADVSRLDDAAAAHRRALELNPDSFAAHSNLGSVLEAQGQVREAIAEFREALRLNPESHETLVNLGVALKRQGRLAEAEEALRQSLDLRPRSDAALSNLGSLLLQQGRVEEAFVTLQLALDVNPRNATALINMGNVLKDLGRFSAALLCLEQAVKYAPQSHLAHNNLGTVLNELGRAEEAVACFRRALELRPDYHWAQSNLLFTMQYLPGVSREALFAEHVRYDEKFARPLRPAALAHRNSRDPGRRLRIGYVSGDFREHSVAFFIEPVLAAHDAAQFEIFCYANQVGSDAMTRRLQKLVPHWREVALLDDDALADRIRRDEIDILVDLSGHTARHRLLTFARKPAPVQVTMIGYMHSTGLSAMDYRVSDPQLDPPGATEAFHSEQLIRLIAGAATFQPPADCPPVNALPALTNGHITFGAFNNPAKITPEAVAAWAEVLRALPDSRLIVVGRGGNSIKPAIVAQGIAEERIESIERQPLLDYLALHHRCDLLLDSFPYNGGTTGLFAIWMGVPFVTLDGANGTGRAGGALLRPLGLDSLIAATPADYVRRTIDATRDLPQLANWRASIRDRLAPLLGGGDAYTRQLEAAFRSAWRHWCAESPASPAQP